jgi:hypothetical protein
MNFDKDFSIIGFWWIPQKEERHFGELIYKQNDNLSLNIKGAFNGVADLMGLSQQNMPVIYGIDKKGCFYTLLNATGETYGKVEFYESRFEIEIVLTNHRRYHYDAQKLKIKEIKFSTNFFIPFMYGHYKVPDGPWLQNHLLQFSLEELPNLALGSFDLYDLYFYFSYAYGYNDEKLRSEFKLNQDIFLCVNFKNEIEITGAISEANNLKDFFSLFCSRQVSFKNFILLIENDENSNVFPISFDALFKEKSSRIGQSVRVDQVLLPFTQFGEEQLKIVLRNWIANRDFITNGLSLYMAIVYLRLSLPIHAFLNIVFAIETFLNYYFPSEDYLKERFIRLVESNRNILEDYISDVPGFCQKVVKQRNYLAHDHSRPVPAISDQDYHYYIFVLKMLFEIAFSKELGLTESSIKFLISKNYMYGYYKR